MMEMLQFLQKKLFCKNPETKDLEDSVLAIYLKNKFNRPMRVCGMVKNVGEPGGGPFLAYNSDGTISLQILESSQIDMDDPEKKEMFEKGTHFNPVDLVCAVRDYKGHKFLQIEERQRPESSRTSRLVERSDERLEYRLCRSATFHFQSGKNSERLVA